MVVFDLDNSRSWCNYHDSTEKWFDIPKGPFIQDFRSNHLRQQALVVSSNIPNHLSFVWNMIDNSSRWYPTNNKNGWMSQAPGMVTSWTSLNLPPMTQLGGRSTFWDPTGALFGAAVGWSVPWGENPWVDFPAMSAMLDWGDDWLKVGSFFFGRESWRNVWVKSKDASCLVSLKEDWERPEKHLAICDAIRSRHVYNWGIWGLLRFQDGTPQSCYIETPSPLDWVFRCCFLWLRLVSGGLDCQVIIWKPNEGGFVKEKILKLHTDFVGTPGARLWWAFVVRYFCLQIGRDSQNTSREL